jgi:citrate lyase subunit gamma (acyl carrier protein)
MSTGENLRTGQAGTIESMDCLVTIAQAHEGRRIDITGHGASRFKSVMEARINRVVDGLELSGMARHSPLSISVQDNGALDVVLEARLEAAYFRYLEALSR